MMRDIQKEGMRLGLGALLLVPGLLVGLVRADSVALERLFADEWAFQLRENPLMATGVGDHQYDDRLPDVTDAAILARHGAELAFLQRLRAIPRDGLSEAERVSYDLFAFDLEARIQRFEFGEYRLPFTNDSGFFSDLILAFEQMPVGSAAARERYLIRLAAVPEYFRQQRLQLEHGLETGFTMPAVVMSGVLGIVKGLAETPLETHPIYRPLLASLAELSAEEQDQVRASGAWVMSEAVIPAYEELARFLESTYLPGGKRTLGAASLPNGEAYYRFLVRYFTTLETTPRAVHELGLSEVARIRGEMEAVLRELAFEGDFAAFLKFLRTDPQFYADTPEELLQAAAWIAKQVDGMLPAYFGNLPRMPYGVAPVPAHLAPNYTTGRYSPGVPGGSRGGYYWVNTYALEKRPLYALPALTLHEAVPGHHLQIALAQELSGLPEFRRHFYPNAFGEGWALYAEKLGREMGVYHTLYEEFGRLTYEMWRAVRLVVDTGIHAFGWSRERAVALLAENTALALRNVESEVDRYISWPGQALSYKMGELTVLRLRTEAEQALGERFELRAFHDAVLANGGVTLEVLEGQVAGYIENHRDGR